MATATTPTLKALLAKIDLLKGEIDRLRPLTPEAEARVMQKFRLDWNYHSNSIEGNSLTYGETIAFLMEGLTAKGKPLKDHLDIKGHNEGIEYLMSLVKNKQLLTEKVIRELHKIILVEPYKSPAITQDGHAIEKTIHIGQYKTQPNHVKTPTGEVHYYATPEETPAKMNDLMTWLQEHQAKQDLHPLVLAAVFHYRFVAIHPFDDGNGRMSRLLMNLLLLQNGYPPVVIKQENRQAYYYALRQADSGELSAFVEFIGENLVHSMEVYIRGAKGENIDDPGDWEKQVSLLKKTAEGTMPDNINKIKNQEEALAKWLESNFPILWNEFKKRFDPFNSFFISAYCDAYIYYRNSEVVTGLPPDGDSWLEIAKGIVNREYKSEIIFGYYFNRFIYSDTENENSSIVPPLIRLKIDTSTISLADKKWSVFSLIAIKDSDLQPIHDLAKLFYMQIEQVIKKHE